VVEVPMWDLRLYNYKLVLQRRPQFIVINMVTPVIVLTFLNCLVFLLPPSCGEKLTLCISILLSFAVFMTVIKDSMPTSSLSVSYVAMFIALSLQLGLSGLAVLLTILIIRVSARPDNQVVPPWMGCLNTCACPRRQHSIRGDKNGISTAASDWSGVQSMEKEDNFTDVTWNLVARSLDTCLFRVYLSVSVTSVVVLVCLFTI
jgi:hypothetical protein